jgi:hypothetical protein
LGQAVDETKTEYSDIAILTDGNSVFCKITAFDSTSMTYVAKDQSSKTIPANDVLTFSIGNSKRYQELNLPASIIKDKYFDEQDLFLLHSGRRLKATLLSINSLNFVIRLSPNSTWAVTENGIMDLPQDSVYAFYSQKPFIKQALKNYDRVDKLYAPYQDLDRLVKKDHNSGNWNADYIVLTTGEIIRGIIVDADSTKSLTYKPAYFSHTDFGTISTPWEQIRTIDYWVDPSPFKQKRWHVHAEQFQEPKLKSVLARSLSGNIMFMPTKIEDELKLARRSHQWLFLRGSAFAAGGLWLFGYSWQGLYTSIGDKTEARYLNVPVGRDGGLVVTSIGMVTGLGILGLAFHSYYDAVLNLRAYNRLKQVKETLKMYVTPTGVSMKYSF